MNHIFDLCSPSHSKHNLLQEDCLAGSKKVSYRIREDWDFEGGTESAPIDIDLVLPAHRPKHMPERHRFNMFVSSETGPMRVKVCRHCLHRSFNLEVVGGVSDITIWVPSNFKGFISYSSPNKPTYSTGFANHIFRNAFINHTVPKDWMGDEITVSTSGTITFRMWDVFAKTPEVPAREVWKKMFHKGGDHRLAPAKAAAWNWDFLLEDDDD
ncbi:hypothetical protein BD410DRAFT_835860 [Rickenella mellea]|uniref:DUF7330 domain-containing protein n=1 Tax=Rickenella mellea TaxID=50990 RepID=A0A4Y7QL46_9AGAM|nr:hypothetical protein BD410DRAFT_835860 [Rickenella mellea]